MQQQPTTWHNTSHVYEFFSSCSNFAMFRPCPDGNPLQLDNFWSQAFRMSVIARRFVPLFDRVLVSKAVAEKVRAPVPNNL
jgi:hypothetical protein